MSDEQQDVGVGGVTVWLAALGAGALLLRWTGGGALGTPSLLDPAAWAGWVAATDPLLTVGSLLRLVALALVWYLAGVTAVALVARLLHAELLARGAQALAVGPSVVVVRRLVGTGLAVGVLTSSTVAAPRPTHAPLAATVQDVSQERSVTTTTADPAAPGWYGDPTAPDGVVAPPVPPPFLVHLDGAQGPDAAAPSVDPTPVAESTRPVTDIPVPAAPVPVTRGVEVEVRPGDHLWSMAADALEARHGERQDDGAIAEYWMEVLAANADRLVVPGDPDLLVPGQHILLPATRSDR